MDPRDPQFAPKYAVNLGPMGALGLESRENEIPRFEILITAESSWFFRPPICRQGHVQEMGNN